MSFQTIDTREIKEKIDLRDFAAQHIELRKNSTDDMHGTCPRCGSEHGLHVKADLFHCYGCMDKWGDAVEFVQWMGLASGFRQACELLAGGALPTTTGQAQAAPRPPAPVVHEWRTDAWQRDNVALVEAAHVRLLSSQEAEAGRAYLAGRSLELETWQAFRLGFVWWWNGDVKRNEPAIVMPWFTSNGTLRGVRLRFLAQYEIGTKPDGSPKMSQKTVSVKGAGQFNGGLFGTQALGEPIAQDLRSFVLTEGELNAASIWQSCHTTGLDVLAIGSENAGITQPIADFVGRYGNRLTWLDKRVWTTAKMGAMPGAFGIASPEGKDANDLLKTGELGGFLAAIRFQTARDRREQERLYYDLVDAEGLPGGVDAGTVARMRVIAKALGKER